METAAGEEIGISASEVAQRKEFLEFGPADVALLREIHGQISDARQGFAEGFYEYLRGYDALRELLRDQDTVARLKRSHDLYFSQLTEGEYGWEYVKNRLNVGVVHSRIGLEPKWYVGAYRKYLSDMLQAVWDLAGGERKRFTAAFDALLKVVVFDICLTLDTYIHADQREILRLKECAEDSAASARAAEQRYHDLVQGLNAIVWEADAESRRFTFVSQRAESILGYAAADWLAAPNFLAAILHPEGREAALRDWARLGAEKQGPREFRVFAKNGQEVWLRVTAEAVTAPHAQPALIRGLMVDISERKRAEAQKQLRERAIESSVNGVFIIDAIQKNYPMIYINPAFERITGFAEAEVVGQPCLCTQAEKRQDPHFGDIQNALREGREGYAITSHVRPDGSRFWIELFLSPVQDGQGRITHYVGIINDVTERKSADDRLMYLASHDALTGLPNRSLFHDRLNQMLAHAHRGHGLAAVLFLDLDRFKLINDSLGHSAGDAILKEAAARLRRSLRDGDTVARLGGDEFAIALDSLTAPEDAAAVAQKILAGLAVPAVIGGQEIPLSGSIGISLHPRDGMDGQTLLKNADAAMYRAKENGRSAFRFYSAEMNASTLLHLSMESDLRHALERGEFLLHYQPQTDIDSGRITGVEALLRWRHPERGMIAPAEFIPLAEETGLIVPLGEWVLRETCRQAKAWQAAGHPPIAMAVNLSSRQFRQQDIVALVSGILDETGLDARWLELEITESVVMQDAQETIATLERLRGMGVRLAIDDFGTGYSSLSYLKRFPIHQLKVDQSFIRGIPADGDDASITLAIIAMAHSLGLRVVAEGVETPQQLEFLARNRCDIAQGYHLGRPMDAEAFARILAARKNPHREDGHERPGDSLRQIRECLERVYAGESPEKKYIRQKNREQIEIAGSGEWDDPFGRPAPQKNGA